MTPEFWAEVNKHLGLKPIIAFPSKEIELKTIMQRDFYLAQRIGEITQERMELGRRYAELKKATFNKSKLAA